MERYYGDKPEMAWVDINKLKQEEVPNAQLHIKAADDFIERNTLYQKGVEGLLK